MDFLMESGFMHWMSERMSFTNWVKADFHETSRITLKFSASPRERSARRGEFALRQLLFPGLMQLGARTAKHLIRMGGFSPHIRLTDYETIELPACFCRKGVVRFLLFRSIPFRSS